MAFVTLLICGFAGGLLGGMGMGGGTILIPLLTLLGIGQAAAQGINLLSFLPMAAIALSIHAKNGLVKKDAFTFVLPALFGSVPGAILAGVLPSLLLERAFGVFLIVLSLFRARRAFSGKNARRAHRSR